MPYHRSECNCPDCNPDPGGECSQTPYCQLTGTDEWDGTECPNCEYWVTNLEAESLGSVNAGRQ